MQELTSCFHNGLADSRDGQVPAITPLYCINTYWKKGLEVAASSSSVSIEVTPVLPSMSQTSPGGSKSSWERSWLCHGAHLGHTRWTDRKTRSGHGLGVFSRHGKGPGAPPLLSESAVGEVWPPGPGSALLAAPRASLLLGLWLELFPRPRRILPGYSGLEQ